MGNNEKYALFFPRYWSFGFQISRWGYNNLDDVKAVIERTKVKEIPHVRDPKINNTCSIKIVM